MEGLGGTAGKNAKTQSTFFSARFPLTFKKTRKQQYLNLSFFV